MKAELINGKASFLDRNTIKVNKNDGSVENYTAHNFIIATGSREVIPKIDGINKEGVINSTKTLNLSEIPGKLIVVGGGVIGTEFASLFNSLGSNVTIVEMLPHILPPIDRDISNMVKNKLENDGINILLSSQVTNIEPVDGQLKLLVETGGGGIEILGDKVLIAVGRIPQMDGLNLEEIGLEVNKKGIVIDNKMMTNIEGIYAVGDVTGKNMLAHVAFEQGIVAAENIMGVNSKLDYNIVPVGIYIKPEVASVGYTEERLNKEGIKYNVGVFELVNNSKSVIMNEFEGTLVKIISDIKYGEVLGVHIYGPGATELINEAALAMRLEATLDEIITTIHPHPTVGEGIKEAAMATFNKAIHASPQ